MGFLRKGLFVATGGLSGVAVKANSKKERTAKALEQQNKLLKEQAKLQKQLARGTQPAVKRSATKAPLQQATLGTLHDCCCSYDRNGKRTPTKRRGGCPLHGVQVR